MATVLIFRTGSRPCVCEWTITLYPMDADSNAVNGSHPQLLFVVCLCKGLRRSTRYSHVTYSGNHSNRGLLVVLEHILDTMFNFEALFTCTVTEIWTEIRPVKVLHCVNGDGPKFRQNGCRTHLSQIWVTPYVAVLKLYRAEFKINSVSVRVNKALCKRKLMLNGVPYCIVHLKSTAQCIHILRGQYFRNMSSHINKLLGNYINITVICHHFIK